MRQDMRQSWRNPSLIWKWNSSFHAMFVMKSAQLSGNWGNTVLRQNTRFWGSSRVPLAQKLTSINANWTFTMMLRTWNWQIILVRCVENNLEGHLLSELTWLQFTLRTGELVCEECLILTGRNYVNPLFLWKRQTLTLLCQLFPYLVQKFHHSPDFIAMFNKTNCLPRHLCFLD